MCVRVGGRGEGRVECMYKVVGYAYEILRRCSDIDD